MYKEEWIKDFYGRPIGIIEIEQNGNKTARLYPTRQPIGFYKKDRDMTVDFYGRPLTSGDTLAALIHEHDSKKGK